MRQQNYLELSRQMNLVVNSNPEQSLSQVFGVGRKEVSLRPTPEEVRSKTLVESFLGYVKSSSAVEHAQRMRQLEDKFFEDLNVDPNITIYGQTGTYQDLYQSYEYIGFYYSLEDMEKMRVKDISVVGGAWSPEKNQRYSKAYLASMHDEYEK